VQVSASDLSIVAGALEKAISYSYPQVFRGIESGGEPSPDEWEIVYLFRKLGDPARRLFALKELQRMVDSAVEADMEAERRDFERYRLGDDEP
jgi:hypothetical protein